MCFIYVGWPFVLLSNSINPPESDRYLSHPWIKNYFLPLGIEDWIREKADYRLAPSGARFAWPYDVGRWNNLRQVGACKYANPLISNNEEDTDLQVITWSCQPLGDGISWPVVEGADQYTLTRWHLGLGWTSYRARFLFQGATAPERGQEGSN